MLSFPFFIAIKFYNSVMFFCFIFSVFHIRDRLVLNVKAQSLNVFLYISVINIILFLNFIMF